MVVTLKDRRPHAGLLPASALAQALQAASPFWGLFGFLSKAEPEGVQQRQF